MVRQQRQPLPEATERELTVPQEEEEQQQQQQPPHLADADDLDRGVITLAFVDAVVSV